MVARANARVPPCGRNLSIGASEERAGDVVTMFHTVLGTCIHKVKFSRNAVITGHSTINVGQHLDAEIGLSNASDAHPLNYACIQIKYGL